MSYTYGQVNRVNDPHTQLTYYYLFTVNTINVQGSVQSSLECIRMLMAKLYAVLQAKGLYRRTVDNNTVNKSYARL